MFLMDYIYIRSEDLPDDAKNPTWKILNVYIDAHSKILIDEYPGYVVQAISILKSQYANMTFS